MSVFNTSALSPMALGRLKTVLDKRFNFQSVGVMTLGDYLESQAETLQKSIGDYQHKFDRRKFNRMGSYTEQAAYEAKLRKPCYNAWYRDGYCIEIPKIVYDVLNVPVRA